MIKSQTVVSGLFFDDLLCSTENNLSMKIINYIFRFIWEHTIMYKKPSFKGMKRML